MADDEANQDGNAGAPRDMQVARGEGKSASNAVALIAVAVVVTWRVWRDAHPGLYGDGPLFVELWRNGIWVQAHFLLLPLAILLRAALAPVANLDRADAIRTVSGLSSVLGAAATQLTASRLAGPLAAALATLTLVLAPPFRFYSGAVEVHALAFACVAVAGLIVLHPARTRRRARIRLVAAVALAASAHASLVVSGLPLLLLHGDAERRAGRPFSPRIFFLSGAIAALGLLALLGLILLTDRLGAPEAFAQYSAIEQYRSAMVAWNESIPRPAWHQLLVLEVVAPLGVLPWLALPGFFLLWRTRPFISCAAAAWFLLLSAAAIKIGARELGAYVLPAGVTLIWLAAVTLRALAAARWSFALLAAALLLLPALALRAFAARAGLAANEHATIGPWQISRPDLGLEAPNFFWQLATLAPDWLWWGGAFSLALLAAFLLGRRELHRSSRNSILASTLLAALAIAMQFHASETQSQRWPALWRQELVTVCTNLKERVAAADALVAFAPNVETRWTVEHFLGRDWIDLAAVDDAPNEASRATWIRDVEAQFDAAHERGCKAWLSDDALAALFFDYAKRPQAIALVLRWLQEQRIERLPPALPFTAEYLESVLPVVR